MNKEQEVRAAMRGDREAFIRLMRQLEHGLYGTAKAMLRKEEDIADVLQETIMKAYRSLDTLRDPGFFQTWVYRILINECNTMLRRRSRVVPTDTLPDAAAVPDGTDSVELRMAIDRLEEAQRVAVHLYYVQDMPLKQVADTLELSESAVKTRLYRARKALMELLRPQKERMTRHESV